MVHIRVIMNSAVEEVFNFKTGCCLHLFDQNLEIQVENRRQLPVIIPSYFDLESEDSTVRRITTLMPGGNQEIRPGDIKAFYCQMDEQLWSRAKSLTFYDNEGNSYATAINQQ
ncbi:MAG: hypothetical protein WC405_18775 [Syntrophales bacterium]